MILCFQSRCGGELAIGRTRRDLNQRLEFAELHCVKCRTVYALTPRPELPAFYTAGTEALASVAQAIDRRGQVRRDLKMMCKESFMLGVDFCMRFCGKDEVARNSVREFAEQEWEGKL